MQRKQYIKTLQPGKDFTVDRKEITRLKLNAEGFYVLSGPDDTLEAYGLYDDPTWEQAVADILAKRFLAPLTKFVATLIFLFRNK